MMPIAHLVELTYRLLGPYGMKAPQLTPSRVRLLSCSRTFDCSKAKDRLGYTPIVSLERTIESYSHLRAENLLKREGPSKAFILLGGGRVSFAVADILLWKDKRQTLTTVLILVAIYYQFIVPGYTIITMLSKILLLALFFFLIHSILPEKILGFTIEKIPASGFHLSEEKSQIFSFSDASLWNASISVLKSLCEGNDWMLFLKVALTLLILSILGNVSLQSLFVIGIPFFVVFYIYEKKEQKIEAMALKALSFGRKLKSDIARKFTSQKND